MDKTSHKPTIVITDDAVEAAMMEITKGSNPLVRTHFRGMALAEARRTLEAAVPFLGINN